MKQDVWRGMPFYDVFWRKKHLTRRELHKIRANYHNYIFWFLVVSLFVLLDLHGFAQRVSTTALVAYAISLTVITIAFYFFASLAGLQLSKRYSWFFMVYPVVGFMAISLATFIVEAGMSTVFGGGLSFEHAVEKLPVNIVLGLLLETIYLNFVFPAVVSPHTDEPEAAAPSVQSEGRTITISGTTFECDKMISVSSQGHYVRIRTNDGENLLRARLSDLIGQLSCQNGIQPHRSHWVSRRAVVGIGCKDGQKHLELIDESCIPIARGRLLDVQAWLEK